MSSICTLLFCQHGGDTVTVDALPDGVEIESDLACVYCGYNLRTLGVSAKCPECGRGVRDSFSVQPDIVDPIGYKRFLVSLCIAGVVFVGYALPRTFQKEPFFGLCLGASLLYAAWTAAVMMVLSSGTEIFIRENNRFFMVLSLVLSLIVVAIGLVPICLNSLFNEWVNTQLFQSPGP